MTTTSFLHLCLFIFESGVPVSDYALGVRICVYLLHCLVNSKKLRGSFWHTSVLILLMEGTIRRPDSTVVKHISIGAVGLWFNYRSGQFGHSVFNGSPPLRRFFRAVLPRREVAKMGPTARHTLRRTTASIMKI